MNQEELWMLKYRLVKNYYEEYGVVDFYRDFKTNDGITYDASGCALGYWLYDQIKLNETGQLLLHRKELLEELGISLTKSFAREDAWISKYRLLMIYYNYYGNSEVLYRFKTNDGINYSEDGIKLGRWVHEQRRKIKTLSPERLNYLRELDFRTEITNNDYVWDKNYALVKKYYDTYGNIQIPFSFKTKDGVNYSEDGKRLRQWLNTQINLYRDGTLLENRYELLKKLGLNFGYNMYEYKWNEMYKLAMAYYREYGDLEVNINFKTRDGITYFENGFNLGSWVRNQRLFYSTNQLTKERYELLCKIGMRFEGYKKDIVWNKMYGLLKRYYEKYGNLEISSLFRTKDGVNHDCDGVYLRAWLLEQIRWYKEGKLSKERIEMLRELNIDFDESRMSQEEIADNKWNEMYNLASIYYETYYNLEITRSFKTNDGINYSEDGKKLGTWISSQRYALYPFLIFPHLHLSLLSYYIHLSARLKHILFHRLSIGNIYLSVKLIVTRYFPN